MALSLKDGQTNIYETVKKKDSQINETKKQENKFGIHMRDQWYSWNQKISSMVQFFLTGKEEVRVLKNKEANTMFTHLP